MPCIEQVQSSEVRYLAFNFYDLISDLPPLISVFYFWFFIPSGALFFSIGDFSEAHGVFENPMK